MLETLHRAGSAIRNSELLRRQAWLWGTIEPLWQRAFGTLARGGGYAAHINAVKQWERLVPMAQDGFDEALAEAIRAVAR